MLVTGVCLGWEERCLGLRVEEHKENRRLDSGLSDGFNAYYFLTCLSDHSLGSVWGLALEDLFFRSFIMFCFTLFWSMLGAIVKVKYGE